MQGSYICIIERFNMAAVCSLASFELLNFLKTSLLFINFLSFFHFSDHFLRIFFLEISISKSHFTTDNILENYGNSKICNSCHTMIYIDLYIGYLSECRPLLHIKLLVLRYSIRYRYFPN